MRPNRSNEALSINSTNSTNSINSVNRSTASSTCERGMTLIELVICLGLVGLVLLVAVPALGNLARSAGLGAVSRKVSSRMAGCRAQAMLRGRSIGMVFEHTADGVWSCYTVEDGDNDGIHSDDIRSGRDRRLEQPIRLEAYGASPGFLAGEHVPDPSGHGLVRGNLDDPIRSGPSNIVSFTPQGTATPCSIYFTDHRARMQVLRIYGATGKVHQLRWSPGKSRWEAAGL